MKQNVAGQVIGAEVVSATDGSAITTGVSVSVTGDGGTQAAGGGTVTHKGNGYWSYAPTQAETNYAHVAFTFTGTGAIPVTVQVYTTFPQTGDSYARLGAPAGASVSADIAGVQSDTNDIQSRLPAALVGGRIAANAEVVGDKTGYSISGTKTTLDALNDLSAAQVNAEVDAALDTALPVTPTAGSINDRVKTNLDAAVSSRSSHTAAQAASAVRTELATELGRIDVAVSSRASQVSLDAVDDFVDTEVAAIKAKTDQLTFTTPNRVDSQVAGMNVDTIDAVATAADFVDEIWDEPLAEPAGPFAWSGTFRQLVQWLGLLSRNKLTQTATTQAVRNDADTLNVATAPVSDDGTTFTRGEWA